LKTARLEDGALLQSGGRGGYVYVVPNLDDSGEGSLRYGVTELRGARTISVTTSNVVVRNLRFRRGNAFTGNPQDALRVVSWTAVPTTDVIIDHCTVSWPVDESIDTGLRGVEPAGLMASLFKTASSDPQAEVPTDGC
jgi:hypothetical protein